MKNIKKLLSSKCIGYSENWRRTYFEHEVLLNDNTTKVAYSYSWVNDGGDKYFSQLTSSKPYVARLQNGDASNVPTSS